MVDYTKSIFFCGTTQRSIFFCETTQFNMLWDYKSPYFVGLQCTSLDIAYFVPTQILNVVGLQKSILCGGLQKSIFFCGTTQRPYFFVRLHNSICCGTTKVHILWDYNVQVWTLQSHNCGHCVVPQNMDFCSPTTVGHVLLSVVPQIWTL